MTTIDLSSDFMISKAMENGKKSISMKIFGSQSNSKLKSYYYVLILDELDRNSSPLIPSIIVQTLLPELRTLELSKYFNDFRRK